MTIKLAAPLAFLASLLIGQLALAAEPVTPPPLLLWYPRPAAQWTEALPLGNGRLGAMVFGGVGEERLQLNEDTFWSGSPHHNNVATAHDAFPEIRRLIFAGDYAAASKLAGEKVLPGPGKPNGMSLQPVGDLRLHFPGHENFSHYRRELSLDDATVRIRYDVGSTHYTREIFTSLADQVIVVRLTASKPRGLSFTADWSSPQLHAVRAESDGSLVLAGTGPGQESIPGKVAFDARLRVIAREGTLDTVGANVGLKNGAEALLLVAIGTNFVNYHDLSADAATRARTALDAAAKKDFATLHAASFRRGWKR